MTNLEALRATVNFPLEDIKLKKILTDVKLSELEDYAGMTEQFEKATAYLYVLIVTSPNVSEGDFSLSLSEKESYINLANDIFSRYNMPSPFDRKNRITNRSNFW